MRNEYPDRRRQLTKLMGKKKISAAIFTDCRDVEYLSGFTGHDSWLLVVKGRFTLITDSRYDQQAKKQCPDINVLCRTGPMSAAITQTLKRYKNIRLLRVDDKCTLGVFQSLRENLDTRLKSVSDLLSGLREYKSDYEANNVKKAANIAWTALENSLKQIRAGISETELAAIIECEIKKLGAVPSFETIVAFSANAAMPHYQPGRKKLKKTDTILIDFGACYRGYCSDITRCYPVGKIRQQWLRAYQTVLAAQEAAVNTAVAGAKLKDVDAAARRVIKEANLPVFGHGTGHGLGLDVHENPALSPRSKGKLKKGHIVTIEPGVYIPNLFGIRIEDDYLITENGTKCLTGSKSTYADKNRPKLLLSGKS